MCFFSHNYRFLLTFYILPLKKIKFFALHSSNTAFLILHLYSVQLREITFLKLALVLPLQENLQPSSSHTIMTASTLIS